MKKILLSSLLIANGVIASPFVVEDIRVNGALGDTETGIISKLPVQVGQRVTDKDLTKIVQQLFVQKRFDDVSAKRDGNTIVINVVERPLIANVRVEGNKAIPDKALEENLKANLIAKGEFFDPQKIAEIKQELIKHYHSIGRYSAKVNIIAKPLSNGQVDVTFDITENEVSYVKEIHFRGNKAFDEDDLISKLDIQPNVAKWNIFQSSKYEEPALKKDSDTLYNFYRNQGYVKFMITDIKTDFSNGKKNVKLTYKINEGSQYKVSKVRFIGETANLDKELNDALKEYETGDLYRAKDIETLREKLVYILGENGYADPDTVTTSLSFNEEAKTVAIAFIINANRRLYVRKISFEGNNKTADSTLRREMRQQEGAWLSTTAVEMGKARLERTGFYDSVEKKILNVPGTTDQVDIIYSIKEGNTGSINLGIGYGSGSGFSYQAGIKQDNFLGMGSSIGLNGVRNDYSTTFSVDYNEPYFTKDGVSLGGNFYYSNYDYSKMSSSSKYKRTTFGIDGTLGFPVDEYNSYYLGLGVVSDKIQNVGREYTREKYVEGMGITIPPQSTEYAKIKTLDFNFKFGWNYNSLDRGFMPTEGLKANIGGTVTVPGSDNKYYQLSAKASYYYPLNRAHSWVINTRAKLGYQNGFGGKEVPFFQTYSAGGIGSVRGFSHGSIGPKAIYWKDGDFKSLSDSDVIGGNALAVANVELIMPTPFISEKYQHRVRTALFVDAGTVWNTKWKKIAGVPDFGSYKRFRASAGIGLQWSSPIGPLVLSYAKPLRKHEKDSIEQFQFSIGSSF